MIKTIFTISCLMIIISCSEYNHKTLVLKNTLDIERRHETIGLTSTQLGQKDITKTGIKNLKTGKFELTQLVDNDGDEIMDEILFQPILDPNSEQKFAIVKAENKPTGNNNHCYSRFVPERTDDYAWENDRVAFRIFGPNAQYRFKNNLKEGTLSSGIDAWLKRVEYPIINKWYKKYSTKTGSYHKDTGEGLDNFHVGISRGVGGTAIKQNNQFYFSENFTKWRTITKGPIRTSFYIEYEKWKANGLIITEAKTISLDKGQNLSKIILKITGTDTISTGLTLHDKDGNIFENKIKNWVSYWQPHGDSELGTGIVASQKYFLDTEKYIVQDKDLSHIYTHLKVIDNTSVYYTGYGWKKSEQFKNQTEWESYLTNFALKINHPILITIK